MDGEGGLTAEVERCLGKARSCDGGGRDGHGRGGRSSGSRGCKAQASIQKRRKKSFDEGDAAVAPCRRVYVHGVIINIINRPQHDRLCLE